jgi:hypothetical protein
MLCRKTNSCFNGSNVNNISKKLCWRIAFSITCFFLNNICQKYERKWSNMKRCFQIQLLKGSEPSRTADRQACLWFSDFLIPSLVWFVLKKSFWLSHGAVGKYGDNFLKEVSFCNFLEAFSFINPVHAQNSPYDFLVQQLCDWLDAC